MSNPFPADDERHGTYAGYVAHTRHRIPSCEPCKQAHRTYIAALRAKDARIREEARKNTRAHNRAKQRLADAHRDEYERILLEEKRREWTA